MDNSNSQVGLSSPDGIAIGGQGTQYSHAQQVEQVAGYQSVRVAWQFSTRLSFLIAEITGLLFVVFTTLYIFVMPLSVSSSGGINGMISRFVKRTFDIVGAVVGLVCALPFMILLPIIIKLESCGPVFYAQTRVGVNRRGGSRRTRQLAHQPGNSRSRERRREDYFGQVFIVYKFRTMAVDAESASGPVWATEADPRITRVGRFLRKCRLDEIPQFFNVLIGDMSLVGPRPERPHFVKELSTEVDDYTKRLRVKPGITGLAQIRNGYDSSISSVVRKVQSDLTYIDNQSLWMDIKILVKTIWVVLTGRGAN